MRDEDENVSMVKPGGKGLSDKVAAAELNRQMISSIVAEAAAGMRNVADPERQIPLTDLSAVKAVSVAYLDACAARGVLPSMSGLSKALGRSRQSVYAFIRRNPESDVAAWLTDFSDSCGEAMMTASLHGAVQPVVSIFVSKCRYGWREDQDELPISSGGEKLSAAEIMERYGDLPDGEDE